MPPYSLTDNIVFEARLEADNWGVAIRIVMDARERQDFGALGGLADNVRTKRSEPFLNLKAYAIDVELLRTRSANFSSSGERQQDNDWIAIHDPEAAHYIPRDLLMALAATSLPRLVAISSTQEPAPFRAAKTLP